jgi:HK97 gp10 family phage protein
MNDTTVKGLAQLQAALDSLPAKIEANIMRGAMRAGAKLVLADAKRSASFADRTGALRDSLRITTSLKRGTVLAAVKAGATAKDKRPFYAGMVEFGTAAHVITAGPGKLLPVYGGVKSVHHPGARKHPYLRPALDTQGAAAVAAAAEYIRKRLATKYGIDVPAPAEEGDE